MGYHTEFEGKFSITPSLTDEQFEELSEFTDTRHDERGAPGIFCQWVLSRDGDDLQWDGGEKFYYYVEWLEHLIKHFFQPWGRMLNGEVVWSGEITSDVGIIRVEDNAVEVFDGTKKVVAQKSQDKKDKTAEELQDSLKNSVVWHVLSDREKRLLEKLAGEG